MKRRLSFLLMAVLMVFSACLAACSDDAEKPEATASQPARTQRPQNNTTGSTNEGRRDYYNTPLGGGEDVFTMMVYICGSDLESESGAATDDITEMLYSEMGDNVNLIITTGGASEWQNRVIPDDTNMYWQVTEDGLTELEDVGLQDMTRPGTLTDFIEYCAEEYPANRYGLILWDHGGGTVGGFASDENFADSPSMSVIEMDQALYDAGLKFDIIGFDACLMATAETAFMLELHADYLVASQRVEPASGWHYTEWLTALGKDPSMDTLELGRQIADSFIESASDGYYGDELTLSVLDLTYVNGLFDSMDEFFSTAEQAMVDGDFMQVSKARYDSRDLTGNYEQVDIAYLVENMGSMEEAEQLLQDLDNVVAYNAVSDELDNHNGLCLYFPYEKLENLSDALDIYDTIGISEGYSDFIKSFSTLMVGGQAYNQGGSGNPGGQGFDEDYWLGLGWVNTDLLDDYEENYSSDTTIDELIVDEKGDDYVLSLTDDQWDIIIAQELNVFAEVEGGSIDLGTDNVYEFDEDGDLLIEFDYTWVALDGGIVPFYAMEEYSDDDYWYSYGYVPCYINGSEAELELVWDSYEPYGYVAGYRFTHENLYQKGLLDLEDGDEIEVFFDMYDEDGNLMDEGYSMGVLTVDGDPEVSYEDIGDADCEIYYTLYDIYQNAYWTESIFYTS